MSAILSQISAVRGLKGFAPTGYLFHHFPTLAVLKCMQCWWLEVLVVLLANGIMAGVSKK